MERHERNEAPAEDANPCPDEIPYSLVIPAYNEEMRIPHLLAQIEEADGEFIFICEGTDATTKIIHDFAASHPGICMRWVSKSVRLGKGGAVMEGFLRARAPLVGYVDADGSTSIREMLRLFAGLDGADVIIGSRWTPGAVLFPPQGLGRRIQSRAFNLIIRLLFGLPFKDTQCGAKVFKKAAIDAVIRDIISRGFEFDVELLWRLRRNGFSILECPISWQNMGSSRVRFSDVARMACGLFKIRLAR